MEYQEFEMPTPCQRCDKIFDLNDGMGSEKWYPNTIICESCGREEEKEIESDEELSTVTEEFEDALYTASEKYVELDELLQKRSEMGIVEEPIWNSITTKKLEDIGWVIDKTDPIHPISKDLVDRSQLTEDDDPDDYVCSLVYSQMNGSGEFGLLINEGYVIKLNVTRIEELKILEHLIGGVDPPF